MIIKKINNLDNGTIITLDNRYCKIYNYYVNYNYLLLNGELWS